MTGKWFNNESIQVGNNSLTEGTIVECVLKSPSSDLIAHQIRGAVIALRNEDSNQILVSMWKHMEAD